MRRTGFAVYDSVAPNVTAPGSGEVAAVQPGATANGIGSIHIAHQQEENATRKTFWCVLVTSRARL